MKRYRTRIDRRTAERLLGGEGVAGRRSADPELRRLAAVLSAAAGAAGATSAGGGAPAAPGAAADAAGRRLPGETEAVAAFLAARRSRPGRRRSVVARALTAKVAVGAVVALTVGGAAVATGNAGLTDPLRERAAAPSASPSPLRSAHRPASPSPSLTGLCEAYQAEVGEKRRREALESATFDALIAAAGGVDQVPSYCADLIGEDAPGAGHGHGGPDGDRKRPPGGRNAPTAPRGTGPPDERPG